MTNATIGKEVLNGFNALGGAAREAGKRRNMEMVAKQGYVAFRNPNAVAAFHSDPEYVDWTCQFVDGEYRFFPPENKKENIISFDEKKEELKTKKIETKDVVDTYKKVIADATKTSFVSITVEKGQVCHYKLIATDKKTGEQVVVQDFRMEFDGQFSAEIIPSIYNQLMGGLPVLDQEKGAEGQKTIVFQNIDGDRMMGISNLNYNQVELINNMKSFVEQQYFGKEESHLKK